ncbi:hypothetical protein E2P81_ATG01553 [Venturia nashicola]|uniref:Uncharacterized protein n=1 Tax=Venturia nashicola TaxID=86259 RepID=A0A4Z1PE94_9PEZI|nr:hypothetical protein E6O75_ATG01593 [Venturia nashicola]TLD39010.1 hypothetical protein E2P81_ATG01553 [Venturia nashicola]
MDAIKNQVTDAVGKEEDKAGQPGNGIERGADNAVNGKVDEFANDAGVPQAADKTINDAVDSKVNGEIPGGN